LGQHSFPQGNVPFGQLAQQVSPLELELKPASGSRLGSGLGFGLRLLAVCITCAVAAIPATTTASAYSALLWSPPQDAAKRTIIAKIILVMTETIFSRFLELCHYFWSTDATKTR
jgi:hypothetical protein